MIQGRVIEASGLLAIGLLAAIAAPAAAQALPSQSRSVTDVRPRIPDEHDRPYFRETQSHRGWEVREPRFTVFAATSAGDARWAAAHVSAAWTQASRLADRFTDVHQNPDFGLSALQVAINEEPAGARYLPATTITGVGIQTQVTLHVGQEQPNLAQQVVRLREASAFAMLHTAGLDSAAPPWVVKGLAAAAARTGLSQEQLDAAVDPAANMGGEQWRFQRSQEDTLRYAPLDQEEAAARVAFLLHGDDAEHAPLLFGGLRQAMADAAEAAAEGKAFRSFPGDAQPASANTAFDRLMASLGGQYAAWKQNPLARQPVFEPAPGDSADVVAAEREMVVLLKLQRRLVQAGGSGPSAIAISGDAMAPAARPKVITFDRAKGVAVSEPAKRATRPLSMASFVARLTDPTSPVWATVDVNGELLLSTDKERVQSLLAGGSQSYTLENDAKGTILVRRLDGGTAIRGWLEENPKDKSRPLARFEVVGMGGRGKIQSLSQPQRQASNLPR